MAMAPEKISAASTLTWSARNRTTGGATAPPKKPEKVWKENAWPIRDSSITSDRME
ncbi:hypothetical protein D3C83_144360 [compost metagenome]